MNVLFVVPYPIEAPSSRYRVYQYLPYLRAKGINPVVSRFIDSSEFFQQLYRPGQTLYKAAYFTMQTLRRLLTLTQVRQYDAVFIQREALPVGPAVFEQIAARFGSPIIYDFDDAIYLPRSSSANRWASWLKQPQKTARIIKSSHRVIAGNPVLYDYARRYNSNVTIVPSSIDTDAYTIRQAASNASKPVVIGWVGTGTNLQYIAKLAPVLKRVSENYNVQIQIVGGTIALPGVNAECRPWTLENEVSDLQGFDIGIMPLPDDEWTRGKGGFKAIQYMGVGLPVVASPVGINASIIADGVSGYLAKTDQEWEQSLVQLIESPALRQQFGLAGRTIVENEYSTAVNGPKLYQVLQSI